MQRVTVDTGSIADGYKFPGQYVQVRVPARQPPHPPWLLPMHLWAAPLIQRFASTVLVKQSWSVSLVHAAASWIPHEGYTSAEYIAGAGRREQAGLLCHRIAARPQQPGRRGAAGEAGARHSLAAYS